jgi:hypothetical protein
MKPLFNLNKPCIALILSLICSCESKQSGADISGACIHVKVISTICNEFIFQILDSKFYELGENGWSSGMNRTDHVFFTTLGCTDLEYLSRLARPTLVALELYLQIVDINNDFNCATCQATLGSRPKKQYAVKTSLGAPCY